MAEIFDIKKAAELTGNDMDLLRELMDSFVKDVPLSMEKLEQLEGCEDKTEAAKYVHYYKGAGRQLCAQQLAQAGQNLEDVLRGRTEGNLSELNKAFFKSYQEAKEEIQDALEIL